MGKLNLSNLKGDVVFNQSLGGTLSFSVILINRGWAHYNMRTWGAG